MKFAAVKQLREKLAVGSPVYGLWVTTEAIAVTELAVGIGLEYVFDFLGFYT